MIIDKKALLQRVSEATITADRMLTQLRGLAPLNKMQRLFDISSFDCNKHIIWEMLNLLMEKEPSDMLDLSSERRNDVLFPIGTVVRINYDNDKHNYPVGSLSMIARHYQEGPRNKVYMQGLREDGTLGSGLYFYGIDLFRAFLPVPQAAEQFVRLHIPDETNNPTILRAVNLTIKGVDHE